MASTKTISIKLIKSPIGCTQKQIATVKGLGFKKLHQVKKLEDTPSVRGMVKSVIHMLEIQK